MCAFALATEFLLSHLSEVGQEHKDEVHRLLVIQTAEQMANSDLAQLWLTNKYKLSMSSFSYELLMTFLQDHNYMLLRTMLNEHLAISSYSGYPQAQVASVTLLDRDSLSIIDASEPAEVHWGVPKELLKYYEIEEEEAPAANGEAPAPDAAPETEEEAATKKRKRETTAKRKAQRKTAEARVPVNNKVPIQSDLGVENEKEFLADIRARANLSSETLPSIALYTIFNTHGNMTSAAVSKDAGIVATGFGDSVIKLWDVQGDNNSGQPSRWQQAQEQYVATDGRVEKYRTKPSVYSELVGHSQAITSLDFAPDSSYLMSSSADGTVRLWSMDTKSDVVCYRGHNFPVWQARFAPLGYYFATASHDRTARLWVTSNLNAMRIFAGHTMDVNTVAFHPNYYYLFTGSADKTLRLWEVQTGDCVRLFVGHAASVNDAQVSPDGRFAVSAGEDAMVNIWELSSGKRVAMLKGHTAPIWSVDISGDGALVASGAGDDTVRLWDLRMITDSQDSTALTASSSASADPARFDKAALGSYSTKSTPVHKVSFTRRNLLTAAGPFRPPVEQGN